MNQPNNAIPRKESSQENALPPTEQQSQASNTKMSKSLSSKPDAHKFKDTPKKNPVYSPILEEPSIEYAKFNLVWKNLKISVKETGKQIIPNFSGLLQSGSLVAILGASGSGKTTFMNYISGYTRNDLEVDCTLKVNNVEMKNIKALKRISGYVFQEDVLIPELTVYETLHYQAKLKLPIGSNYDSAINLVVGLMNLQKCIDQKIGDGLNRGLSGGQRRRVSIACELVTDPYLFLLDEPTTGLDSENAENVVDSLRTLAGQGKLVVTTIHQPSSEILAMFDKIIILHQGVKVYDGPFESMKPWFLERGFSFPKFANPCEFIMNL